MLPPDLSWALGLIYRNLTRIFCGFFLEYSVLLYLLEWAQFYPSENRMKMGQEVFAPVHPISVV